MTASLAEALDWCVDAIAARGYTVRECLDAWPEHEAELTPLLPVVEALHMFAAGPVVIGLPKRPLLDALNAGSDSGPAKNP